MNLPQGRATCTLARVDEADERADARSVERRSQVSTTAWRIRSLYLAVLDARGEHAAQEFLQRAGIQDDLIADETRPVPSELWHRALARFEELLGPEALDSLTPYHLHPDNLGVWPAVLRGATTPSEAYRQLDRLGAEGDEVARSDWTTVAVCPASWLGTAPLPARREDHERVTRARLSELRSLATLFGCRAHVQVRPAEEGTLYYEVHWSHPWQSAPLAGALLGGAGGGMGGWWLDGLPGTPLAGSALLCLVGGLLGLAAGAAGWHDAQRRAQAKSQAYRIQALERSAALRSRQDAGGPAFESGTVLGGQFRLRKPVGLGAAGSVWEAERLADKTPVALKLLRTAVAHDSQAADRLRREADALGLAWHPNVVEVFDHGLLSQGIAYLVMELLVGETLAQRLDRGPRLTSVELFHIALQACDALDAIHAAGVIHRDIKPSNLFLTRNEDGSCRLKLIDFGVAQVAWAETRLTRSGTPLGTPGYMAPEQEAGRTVDGRSDLYSLGGVLYQVLVGRPPPIPKACADGGPPVLWLDLSEVEPGWREIIQRLLAPWPSHRFPDARSLRDAIRALPEHSLDTSDTERFRSA